jgi:hypothetical protein
MATQRSKRSFFSDPDWAFLRDREAGLPDGGQSVSRYAELFRTVRNFVLRAASAWWRVAFMAIWTIGIPSAQPVAALPCLSNEMVSLRACDFLHFCRWSVRRLMLREFDARRDGLTTRLVLRGPDVRTRDPMLQRGLWVGVSAQAAAAACRRRWPCKILLATAYQVSTMAALAMPRTVSCRKPHWRNRALMHSWMERLR